MGATGIIGVLECWWKQVDGGGLRKRIARRDDRSLTGCRALSLSDPFACSPPRSLRTFIWLKTSPSTSRLFALFLAYIAALHF